MDAGVLISGLRQLCSEHTVEVVGIAGLAGFLAGMLVGKALPRTTRKSIGGRPRERVESGRDRGDRDRRGGNTFSSSELYVGNLPYDMSEDDLKKSFEKYGKVVSARIITSRSSGTSKGYGFVEMGDVAAAKAARAGLDSEKLQGRRIVVSEAKSHSKLR